MIWTPNIDAARLEAILRARLKEKADADARLQWRKTLPADVRGRMAVIDMARQRKSWFERMGINQSFESCQKFMEEIARKAEKK